MLRISVPALVLHDHSIEPACVIGEKTSRCSAPEMAV